MRTFAHASNATQQAKHARTAIPSRTYPEQGHQGISMHHRQPTNGNRIESIPDFTRDFSRVPMLGGRTAMDLNVEEERGPQRMAVTPRASFDVLQVGVSRPSQPAPVASHSLHGGSTRSGLVPGATEKNPGLIGGVFDTLRDIGNTISTGVGNLVGGTAALLTGIDINTADTSAPAWTPHGAFNWHVTWNMSGRNVGATTNGWLVQHVENTYSGQDSAGAAITNARIGATPSYYEAWPVVAGAVQQPWGGASDDTWARPDLSLYPPVADAATKGRWSMVSEAYFTTTDPTAHGLAPHNVANAGDLPSAVAAPPDLGVARLHRYANGTWDSTTLIPTHSGGNR